MKSFSDFHVSAEDRVDVEFISTEDLKDAERFIVNGFRVFPSKKFGGEQAFVDVEVDGELRTWATGSRVIRAQLEEAQSGDHFPFSASLIEKKSDSGFTYPSFA